LSHHGIEIEMPLDVVVATRPFDVLILERDAKPLGRRIEHAQPFGHHFLADAVAGNHGDAQGALGLVGHGGVSC
jgi:hypothetical protein